MKRLAFVVGARPNFVKVAPLLRCCQQYGGFQCTLIHTGQHYDKKLSDVFFDDLNLPRPDVSLGIGSGTHAQQTARIIEAIEPVFLGRSRSTTFDRVVVVGDVNSTMAATITAAKIGIPVAHVEAGLRSFDRTMPEEVNRIVTDSLCDLLLCSEPAAVQNLKNEGRSAPEIRLVGNVMIDSLFAAESNSHSKPEIAGLLCEDYGVVTLHRPTNVDVIHVFEPLLRVLGELSPRLPLIFPVHPRTRQRIEEFGLRSLLRSFPKLRVTDPLGYREFSDLVRGSRVVITDSGGLQEETTALGIPCLTMRRNTERPITVEEGTSTLIGNDADLLRSQLQSVLDGSYKQGRCPPLWDGKAAERIIASIAEAA